MMIKQLNEKKTHNNRYSLGIGSIFRISIFCLILCAIAGVTVADVSENENEIDIAINATLLDYSINTILLHADIEQLQKIDPSSPALNLNEKFQEYGDSNYYSDSDIEYLSPLIEAFQENNSLSNKTSDELVSDIDNRVKKTVFLQHLIEVLNNPSEERDLILPYLTNSDYLSSKKEENYSLITSIDKKIEETQRLEQESLDALSKKVLEIEGANITPQTDMDVWANAIITKYSSTDDEINSEIDQLSSFMDSKYELITEKDSYLEQSILFEYFEMIQLFFSLIQESMNNST